MEYGKITMKYGNNGGSALGGRSKYFYGTGFVP